MAQSNNPNANRTHRRDRWTDHEWRRVEEIRRIAEYLGIDLTNDQTRATLAPKGSQHENNR